jgi:hypothetical protein
MAFTKLEKMQRFLPSVLRPQTNIMNRGLLYAWSGEDDALVIAVKDAKEQLFVRLAQLQYLDALGSNVGVFRPTVFNLTDSLFRQLIPALSYYPKQVIPTFQKVLDIFFGVGNPIVDINEIRPNEIEITIPTAVPALRRTLKGAHHFHNYSGVIAVIDNLAKTIEIDLDGTTKSLVADEIAGGIIGQHIVYASPVSNGSGSTGVILQFSPATNLSGFTAGGRFMMSRPVYQGGYIPDKTSAFTVTKLRGTLGQTIVAGNITPTLTMTDASLIPNTVGMLSFNFGTQTEESLIQYFGRPNNQTLFIDPGYVFQHNHSIGEVVNVIVTPYNTPNVNGSDYSVYIVGVVAARLLAQQIIESLKAAGVVINWRIVGPVYEC